MTEKNTLDEKLHWYKDAIIYELHIKAFRDGNNDGIGDFEGLLQKLDYLQYLGVTAIWLLPFYPSPLRDDGYDIADYYTINPSYGSIADFKKLLDEAHRRNLKVITELVINHTSDQHPWFQKRGTHPLALKNGNTTYGPTIQRNTGRPASYSRTLKARTGHMTRLQSNIIGTASSITSQTLTTTVRTCRMRYSK
jgi:1,4-alpha-glucan branching enzyme